MTQTTQTHEPRIFHKFILNWGYVESARIVGGPVFGHTEGFVCAEEALADFTKVLTENTQTQFGCAEHGNGLFNFCPRCGKESIATPPDPYDVVNLFDSFWTMTNDEFPHWFEDTGWVGEWELPSELSKPEYTLVIQGTNNFIEDDDGWCEAESLDAYKTQYRWNIRDGRKN